MRRFFIDPEKAGAGRVLLSGPDANHIRNVLRLRPGDPVCLFDGQGREYTGQIAELLPEGVTVSVMDAGTSAVESPVEITIAQGFLKEKKMDSLVRPLTELGVCRLIPFFGIRSVARPDERRLRGRMERWEKIARESLKQCRRSRIPEIGPVVSFAEMVAMGRAADLKIMFWEEKAGAEGASVFARTERGRYGSIFAALGPEGGFSAEEAAEAEAAGFVTAGMGPRILRAETAAIAAAALLQSFFGDLT